VLAARLEWMLSAGSRLLKRANPLLVLWDVRGLLTLGLLCFFAYYKPVESQFSNVNVGLLSSYITYRCKNPGLTLKCISTAASHPNAIESISVKVYKTDRPVKPE